LLFVVLSTQDEVQSLGQAAERAEQQQIIAHQRQQQQQIDEAMYQLQTQSPRKNQIERIV
jgi:hypothetical protein